VSLLVCRGACPSLSCADHVARHALRQSQALTVGDVAFEDVRVTGEEVGALKRGPCVSSLVMHDDWYYL